MKKIALAVLALSSIVFSEPLVIVRNPGFYPGYHRHDGFALSVGFGPAFGPTTDEATNGPYHKIQFTGPGGVFDFKIGGAIQENLILSFDLIGHAVNGPDVDMDGTKSTSPYNLRISDQTAGLGVTYYIMPQNFFVGGTLGFARFSSENDDAGTKGDSRTGFGLHLKAGKEWWVSPNWGLGASIGYAYLAADDKPGADGAGPAYPNYSGSLTSNQLYILFNTTFN